jgi:hypothetical protein
METEAIIQFVTKNFPRLPAEERLDLMTTAWLFLDANGINDLDEETAETLKAHLENHRQSEDTWRELKVGDLGLRGSRDYKFGDDDKLGWLAQANPLTADERGSNNSSER